MILNCHGAERCDRCGGPILRDFSQNCPTTVTTEIAAYLNGKTATCVHLGAATGEVLLIDCPTCVGRVRLKKAVHLCEIFGNCMPDNSDTHGQHGCLGCSDNPFNRNPPK